MLLADHAALDEELQRLRTEVAAAKQAAAAQPDTHDYSGGHGAVGDPEPEHTSGSDP